jgi:hypothetical protein
MKTTKLRVHLVCQWLLIIIDGKFGSYNNRSRTCLGFFGDTTLNIMTLSIRFNAGCRYVNVVMPSVVMLNAVMLL